MSKTIKTFSTLLGGWAYRVTCSGNQVSYQTRSPSAATFKTAACESKETFDRYAEEVGLFDPCAASGNPAVIQRRIDELTRQDG